MSNISFGENSFTTAAAKDAKTKAEASKSAIPKKEEVKNKSAVILAHLEKLLKDQEKILAGMNELYTNYPTNPLSVAINTVEMVINKLRVSIDDEKSFGK